MSESQKSRPTIDDGTVVWTEPELREAIQKLELKRERAAREGAPELAADLTVRITHLRELLTKLLAS